MFALFTVCFGNVSFKCTHDASPGIGDLFRIFVEVEEFHMMPPACLGP